jgi:hypothetical protein
VDRLLSTDVIDQRGNYVRTFLLLAAVLLVSCYQPDPQPQLLILRVRQPQRVNGCNVYLEAAHEDHFRGKPIRDVYMQTICGVPESTLTGKWWWGDGLQPPGFALGIGDCMPLDNIYYCLEDLVHYESATFRPMYEKPDHPKGNLTRIR